MKAMAHSPDVDVVVVEPAGLPIVRTDQVMLSQVLRNLMTNAIKFTEHGEVRLSAAQPSPDVVELQVSDTGIGIAPADIERVFEEFYQVRNRIQQRVSGTGLGLPYARRLVELLGGELTLTSEVGVGSTFSVTIPVALPERGGEDG
jgi:signal transduction histidine kinase